MEAKTKSFLTKLPLIQNTNSPAYTGNVYFVQGTKTHTSSGKAF